MIIQEITNDMAQQQNVEELWAALAASPKGISSEEVRSRLAQFGPMPWKKKRLTLS